MAVMASQPSDEVSFEQKIQPVPSSDKMALDLDINGTSHHDELNNDLSLPETTLKTESSPLENGAAPVTNEVNGTNNVDAFATNNALVADPLDFALESQTTDPSPTSPLNSSQLPDTNTTTTEVRQSVSPEDQQPDSSAMLTSAESAIESAVEDVLGSTSVPPIVEAQESDLRDMTPMIANEIPTEEPKQAKMSSPDLNIDIDPVASQNTDAPDTGVSAGVADLSFDPSSAPNPAPEHVPREESTLPASDPKQDSSLQPDSKVENDDTEMVDAPRATQPSKIAREREEDDELEPSAKRPKTDDEPMLDAPAAPTQNGQSAKPLTQFQIKQMVNIVRNAARTQGGKNFRAPVAELWPNFAALYNEKIEREVDLRSIEQGLKDGQYTSMDEFKAEINVLCQNALTFNGAGHMITNAAQDVKRSIYEKIGKIPNEPVVAPKKEKKAKRSTPAPGDQAARVPAVRRPSKGSHSGSASAATPAPTFALDPSTNTPLIRRGSTLKDGRPPREIRPPKSKDIPYSVRPKSKKNATEMKFCRLVLDELCKPKYDPFNGPFIVPVDPIALNIPTYFQVIKKPMDLSTVDKKLKNDGYSNAAEFEKDIRLMFSNCFKFNPEITYVSQLGKQLEELFETEWAKKERYIAERSPPVVSSAAGQGDSDEEEEEDDDVPDESAMKAAIATLKDRLMEEQTKLIQLMSATKKDHAMIGMQTDMVTLIQSRIKNEEEAAKKQPKKPKAKAAKKASVSAKKAGASQKKAVARPKYMGTLEKEAISMGLAMLPEDISSEILEDIKSERPGVSTEDDGTLELDIDLISVPLLWKIHALVMKYAPQVQEDIRAQFRERDSPRAVAKPPPKKKKNKPMSKGDQERKIEQLSRQVEAFQGRTSGSQSQERVLTTTEQPEESSGDESSDSEEE